MGNMIRYSHSREGDIIEVRIMDYTRRVFYKNKFNIKDKNAIFFLLKTIETYSGLSIVSIIKEKMKLNEWF